MLIKDFLSAVPKLLTSLTVEDVTTALAFSVAISILFGMIAGEHWWYMLATGFLSTIGTRMYQIWTE